MDTLVATPDPPEDKCSECGATLMFHIEHPQGVLYPVMKPMTVEWIVNEELWALDLPYEIKLCHAFQHVLFGAPPVGS